MIEVSVPVTSSSDDNRYTLYHVLVKTGDQSYVLKKRYSDFFTLKQELESLYSDQMPYEFPKKTILRRSTTNAQLAEDRRAQFERFLQRVVADEVHSKWKKSLPFREFLNLPPGSFSRASGDTGAQVDAVWGLGLTSRQKDEPVVDLAHWIDLVRLSKGSLADARSKVFIAPGEARRLLIQARSRFDGLAAGLQAAQQQRLLGDGELRRRQELLFSLRREHDSLEALLSTSTHEGAHDESHDEARSKLFKEGKRVIGKPRETDRTLGVENQHLLQMQKQDFQQQDEQLSTLYRSLQKQKELGIAINEELQIQNELLDEIDSEIDLTESKLKFASKQINKFT